MAGGLLCPKSAALYPANCANLPGERLREQRQELALKKETTKNTQIQETHTEKVFVSFQEITIEVFVKLTEGLPGVAYLPPPLLLTYN